MRVNKETVRKVAKLARLNLSEAELAEFARDFREILADFEILKKIDTAKVEPTFQPITVENVVRKDVVKQCMSRREALSNTKSKEDGYIKGPSSL